jgi:murein DD-endopeptidase MepM/ murein hydrolase activator NlpD
MKQTTRLHGFFHPMIMFHIMGWKNPCALGLLLIIIVQVPSLQAMEWTAIQGDVVTVDIASSETSISLKCFNRIWPVKHISKEHWRGWIGVDLKKKPGTYNISRISGTGTVTKDKLVVGKGKFRISRIKVSKKMAVFDEPTLARIRAEVKALKATYKQHVDATPNIIMHGKPVKGIESTPFGAQRYVNGEPRSPHAGIDIATPAGTAIKTPLAGQVLLVANMYLNGNTVVVGHGNGLVSVYSHMQSATVRQGEWVETHQLIGKVGATGRATGPHLHWGIRFNNARVNPESLLY